MLVEGPARAIFARKLPGLAPLRAFPDVAGFEFVLCGSSGGSDLERRVVRAARAAGVRCAVWLDHWVNYPARFVLGGESVLPDELWVSDPYAERLARATVPGPPVLLQGNPHLEDVVAAIAALEEDHVGERVLYVTEPTSVAAERATGDPRGWGYEERAVLRSYLETLVVDPPVALRLRTHPGEPAGKYDEILASFAGRLPLARSPGTTLDEDCAWADTVVGCETMALAVALAAGRRVVSVVPPGGRFSLPFEAIERLYA